MTDAQLQGIAAQALNMAKRDLERNRFNFLLASYFEDDVPPLHRMDKVEELVVDRLGKDWLNHGSTKDAGFYVLRLTIDLYPPDAVVIATLVNSFKPTERFHALPEAQKRDLMTGPHSGQHKAVAEGILTVVDAVFAIVQTPVRVCQYVQELGPRYAPFGKPETAFYPQEEFIGRLKMFGGEDPLGGDAVAHIRRKV